jgi:hypothetical protein
MSNDQFDGTFVEAVNQNGEKQTVPAEWLEHPVLGKPFSKTPRQRADEKTRGTTSSDKTPANGDNPKE